MSALVGSTPSLIRNGRPNASLSRNSASLMIWTAPFFREAKASPACMIGNSSCRGDYRQRFPRSSCPPPYLFVLVQQLAHLIDCERRVLSIQRLLTFPLFAKNAFVFGKVSP